MNFDVKSREVNVAEVVRVLNGKIKVLLMFFKGKEKKKCLSEFF